MTIMKLVLLDQEQGNIQKSSSYAFTLLSIRLLTFDPVILEFGMGAPINPRGLD